ncbi:3-deoxy-D-manno-octulosonic-acid transferase domain protein [Sulfuricella denitrificans skB26]|uniref:3-deoxy-D-manno-octulosonic acid transferase n=1 Tax=Sulfuricella denitrificans (strain DSM 22764 / NBRC 105220 / skB26) TaxID=1163617 RepID=S6AK31_SULDS|nr:lipid IV(A) 3-deoxy-D-manno-octulosonic acid transferase [Sulfuricella denitrificans]BAN36716.1 3-deoxy-D-manno-octulosonic-acid transferase domain protein [Sulfuricella denitrificans skB26]
MMRRLYTLLLYLLLPYILFHLLWRSRRQPGYLRHIGERFGFYRGQPATPLIWLHAVSVGETRAAVPLVTQLQARYPEHRILLTHMTPTGRDTGRQLFGDQVLQCYLPYDFPIATRRFLRHFKPEIGLLMETEIWFNLVQICKKTGVPLLLVNARMSEKSARKYGRFKTLTRDSLQSLSVIAGQTEADARRLVELGAPSVNITGNLKFDIAVPQSAISLGKNLREQFGAVRPVFLAASTREGEEVLIIEALARIDIPNLLIVIVPRHPQRFDQVADMLTQRDIRFQRRSANQVVAPETQVVLGDSMGEMFSYYATCDIAFIGGSLLPLGGQNLIEAAAMGKPILIGPHTFNFSEVTELAVQAGAAQRVANAEELALMVRDLLKTPERMKAMSVTALTFADRHRGATERLMTLIEPCIS